MTDYKAEDQGLLLVFSDPGKHVSLEEFHDWYDNEHVPLRTSRFAEFLSAARYSVSSSVYSNGTSHSAADANANANASKTFDSRWAAIYSISSNDIFNQQRYTSLRANRSEREAKLIGRIGVLDRRIYRLVWDSAQGASASSAARPAAPESSSDAAPIVVLTSVHLASSEKAKEYEQWYDEEHSALLAEVPGWKRTRRFELVDAVINGKDTVQGDADRVPRVLAMSEYINPAFASSAEFQHATSTPWRNKVNSSEYIVTRERRVCEIYKAWEPEAALKAADQL
ncbi:hypothetical protein IE81DRAFT_326062 [Ceraceosorus guamensis]|uniref:EthD domain-containing protein n=1 Tax=Ceraceosorus guamensis TaxID=1522189 RepID=A0A316VQG7_9BASI|nr:hypothetical protein IE81DRAFT_326062 [Ceraceosorus guamensis]PWN39889.1 hypothetical protein IE81DRAFT_326062 [Ceraceosorus guamensis]